MCNREIKVSTASPTSYERKTMNWELIIGLTIFSLVLAWISDVANDLFKTENEE